MTFDERTQFSGRNGAMKSRFAKAVVTKTAVATTLAFCIGCSNAVTPCTDKVCDAGPEADAAGDGGACAVPFRAPSDGPRCPWVPSTCSQAQSCCFRGAYGVRIDPTCTAKICSDEGINCERQSDCAGKQCCLFGSDVPVLQGGCATIEATQTACYGSCGATNLVLCDPVENSCPTPQKCVPLRVTFTPPLGATYARQELMMGYCAM